MSSERKEAYLDEALEELLGSELDPEDITPEKAFELLSRPHFLLSIPDMDKFLAAEKDVNLSFDIDLTVRGLTENQVRKVMIGLLTQ